MARRTLRKIDVAREILDRAIKLHLDESDYLSAMVLAGAAEDVFHDLLVKAGKGEQAARNNMAGAAVAIQAEIAAGSVLTEKTVRTWMRDAFNWMRHADKDTDPDELTHDWECESAMVLVRASENLLVLTGELPMRAEDVAQLPITRNSR
jgi:hypothetical protein